MLPRYHFFLQLSYFLLTGLSSSIKPGQRSKEEYPKLSYNYKGIAGGRAEFPKNASLVKILALAMRFVLDNRGFRAYVSLSETEGIHVQLPYAINCPREYPHIWVYDRALIFPATITKEELVKIAREIAAAWCPTAQAVWSLNETIWGKDAGNIDKAEESE